jgi:hypothetical protein
MRQAQILLDKAENIDSYVRACKDSATNAKARIFCQYTPWNDQTLAATAGQFIPVSKGVQVVILSPSAEGGMPHTRPQSLICLPAYFPEERLKDTLTHELVHIDQRKNAAAWRDHLAAEGWTPATTAEISPEWLGRVRINPDTYHAQFWQWRGRYIPLPLFEREDKPELREISVRWWDKQEQRLNSSPPASFTQKYGSLGPSSIEHPYELYAYHLDEWTRSRVAGPTTSQSSNM